MKQIILFTIIAFLPIFLAAQDVMPLVISPNPSAAMVNPSEVQAIAHGSITNNTTETLTILWKRTVIELSEGWETAVCDKAICFNPDIDSLSFELAPGEEGNLDIYIYPNMLDGKAIVEIHAVAAQDTSIKASGRYLFNQETTSNFFLNKSDINIYPNPTTHFITLTDSELVDRVIIYNIVGRTVKTFEANYSNYYNVSDLQTGMYLVRLLTERDETLKTIRLSKR